MIIFKKSEFVTILLVTAIVSIVASVVVAITVVSNHKIQVTIEAPAFVLEEQQFSKFEATGYAIGAPYANITRSGETVYNKGAVSVGSLDMFTIAVDPRVIPLGSLVYIDSLGLAMATDTGTKIKGNLIDICFQDMAKARAWGRRNVKLTMLRKGDLI